MAKVMDIIAKETDGKSYHTERFSYDTIGIPSLDYDDSPDRVMKWKESAETAPPKKDHAIDLSRLASEIVGEQPLLTYFWMDQDMSTKLTI